MALPLEDEIARSLSMVVLSYAAHGLGTESLSGLGEITLRDGLVAAAAAVGARRRAAWIIQREHQPEGWRSGNVDLTLWRMRQRRRQWFCAVELKWWHKDDSSNAANRRAKLMRDFVRAGAVYPMLHQPEKMAFVLLLSTKESWGTTVARHHAGDRAICRHWESDYREQAWNLSSLQSCPSVRAAVTELHGMGVQIPNIIHSELCFSVRVRQQRSEPALVRCWAVWKPQRSTFLDAAPP
jgi:hypothetical protein